jgi:hypothetical protein
MSPVKIELHYLLYPEGVTRVYRVRPSDVERACVILESSDDSGETFTNGVSISTRNELNAIINTLVAVKDGAFD